MKNLLLLLLFISFVFSYLSSYALGNQETVVNTREEQKGDLPKFAETTPQLYNQYLINVPNINVETIVGYLPKLPRYVTGVYQEGIKKKKGKSTLAGPNK